MKKILSVDANLINSKIIEQDIKVYFNSINQQFEFFTAQTPQQTLDIINEHQIDIIFLDISSKQFDGIKLLKYIKQQPVRQSKIVGVTVLDDHTYRFKALKQKVYRYIYKPYDNKEIEIVLKKFFSKNYYAKEINRIENFINIEDVDNNIQEPIPSLQEDDLALLTSYEKNHKKHSAKEFLELYEDWEYDVEDLNDLELSLDQIISNLMMEHNLQEAMPDILDILETYNKFLYHFTEFEELSQVVYSIAILLRNIDFTTLTSQNMVSKLILASIQDLVDWKEQVFIIQDTQNVYYINDAIVNSFVQLQDLLS